MSRILTATFLFAALLATVLMAPPEAFFVLVAAAAVLAMWECYLLLESRGARPFKALGCAAGVLAAAAFLTDDPRVTPLLPVMGVTIAASVAALSRRSGPAAMLDSLGSTLFPVLFVGLALSYAVGLRAFEGDLGRHLILLLLVCVTVADSAALYVGRAWGRHRMAPTVSPGKSWEGAAAGMAASVLGAAACHATFFPRLPLVHAAVAGILIAGAGIFGDLTESVVKRAAGAKDSSSLLPGHGGMLDRADSLLFAAPTLYYYALFFVGETP
jgi:phosphatidate cytidylyltransferase